MPLKIPLIFFVEFDDPSRSLVSALMQFFCQLSFIFISFFFLLASAQVSMINDMNEMCLFIICSRKWLSSNMLAERTLHQVFGWVLSCGIPKENMTELWQVGDISVPNSNMEL